jgi:hypothetical protein
MDPISAESHTISAFPERHCCVCWAIACVSLYTAAQSGDGINSLK